MDNYESTESILEQQGAEPSPEATPEAPVQQDNAEAAPETEWTLKFRDQPYVPQSKDELINLAQRGKLYDSKQSEYNEKMSQLEKRAEAVKQYEELAQAMQKNPRFQQQIMDMYYGSNVGAQAPMQQQPDSAVAAQLPPEVAEKITNMEKQLTSFQQAQMDESLNKEINDLQGKYSGYDWKTIDSQGRTLADQIVEAAHEMGGVSLEAAFRHVMWDQMQEMAAANALRAQAEAKQAQAGKGKAVPAPQSQTPAPAQPNVANMSYDEIAQGVISGQLT